MVIPQRPPIQPPVFSIFITVTLLSIVILWYGWRFGNSGLAIAAILTSVMLTGANAIISNLIAEQAVADIRRLEAAIERLARVIERQQGE